MSRTRSAFASLTRAVFALVFLSGCPGDRDGAPRARDVPAPATPAPLGADRAAAPAAGAVASLILGGGATPESTEVSLEQDVILARRVLPSPHRVFFAGGDAAKTVRVLAPDLARPSLVVRLGELFAPRPGRSSRYRAARLPSAEASHAPVEAALRSALSGADAVSPLLLYVASHGEQGEAPRDNRVVLYGGRGLTVAELAGLHDASARPLRAVVAACFSGGFAELAFRNAEEGAGAPKTERCGLFAGPWDRETSGCDPNPDRAAQEGYSLHFLHALRGEDRAGAPLARGALDFDGDGAVGLLDAHTRARIASASADVPTTTSERWLRAAVSAPAAVPALDLVPEETAVVRALGAALGVRTAREARARWEELDVRLEAAGGDLDAADQALLEAYDRLAAALLGRWPMLDDAYHPDFQSTVEREARAIDDVLTRSAVGRAYDAARRRLAAFELAYDSALVAEARVLRLVRAYETLALATALRARGGEGWARYQALLACERWAPGAPE